MTQPTMGLGSTNPWLAAASSRARRMCQRSSSWGSTAMSQHRGPDFAAAAGLGAVGGPQLARFGRGGAFGHREGFFRAEGWTGVPSGRRMPTSTSSWRQGRGHARLRHVALLDVLEQLSRVVRPAVAEAEGQLQQVPGGAGLAGRQPRLPPLLDVGQGLGEILGGLGQGDKGVQPFGIAGHAVASDHLLGGVSQCLAGGEQPGAMEHVDQGLVGEISDHHAVQPHQRQGGRRGLRGVQRFQRRQAEPAAQVVEVEFHQEVLLPRLQEHRRRPGA